MTESNSSPSLTFNSILLHVKVNTEKVDTLIKDNSTKSK